MVKAIEETHGSKRSTPIRNGHIYCSPGCGRPCTMEMYERAAKLAEEAAEKLGPTWKAVVFENMGWHATAVSADGRIKVHVNRYISDNSTNYTAFVGEKDSSGGRWSWSDADPRKAVKLAIQKGIEERDEIIRALDGLLENL